jgi:imidazole glycerol-phosphate synthase subunit HisH
VIALIDYHAGNLTSVHKALATIGADVFVPASPGDLADTSGIIVPGVGHFGATRTLDQPWIDAILARVGEGRPLFGICLGMQWLFEGSDEAPELAGLGLLAGRCYRLGDVRLKPDTTDNADDGGGRVRVQADRIKIPHVGWNSMAIQREASIVDGVKTGSQVYFTHSYVAPVTGDTVAVTEHGEAFAAVVQRGYIGGVQFHPEKSGDVGLQILRNFVELAG